MKVGGTVLGLYGMTIEKAMHRIPLKAIANKWIETYNGRRVYIDNSGTARLLTKTQRNVVRLHGKDLMKYGYPNTYITAPIKQAYTRMNEWDTYTNLLVALIESIEDGIYYNPKRYIPLLDEIYLGNQIFRVYKDKYYGFNNKNIWAEYTKQEVLDNKMRIWSNAFGGVKRQQKEEKQFKLFDTARREDNSTALGLEIATMSKLKVGDTYEKYYEIRSKQLVRKQFDRSQPVFVLADWIGRDPQFDAICRLYVTGPYIDVHVLPETINKGVFDYILVKYMLRTSDKEERNRKIHENIKLLTRYTSNTLKQSWELQKYNVPINLLAIKRIEVQNNELVYTIALKDKVVKVLEGQ